MSVEGQIESGSGTEVMEESRNERVERLLDLRLDPELVDFRPGLGGQQLLCLRSDTLIRLLNKIFGHAGWRNDVPVYGVDSKLNGDGWDANASAKSRVTVSLDGGRETSHEDVGYGSGFRQPSENQAVQAAMEEAVIDSLNRASRQFGDALGNCLQDPEYISLFSSMEQRNSRVVAEVFGEEELMHLNESGKRKGMRQGVIESPVAKTGQERKRLERAVVSYCRLNGLLW